MPLLIGDALAAGLPPKVPGEVAMVEPGAVRGSGALDRPLHHGHHYRAAIQALRLAVGQLVEGSTVNRQDVTDGTGVSRVEQAYLADHFMHLLRGISLTCFLCSACSGVWRRLKAARTRVGFVGTALCTSTIPGSGNRTLSSWVKRGAALGVMTSTSDNGGFHQTSTPGQGGRAARDHSEAAYQGRKCKRDGDDDCADRVEHLEKRSSCKSLEFAHPPKIKHSRTKATFRGHMHQLAKIANPPSSIIMPASRTVEAKEQST